MDAAFEQRVRERAYDIWVAAGKEDGLADLHWLSAEQAVRAEASGALVKMPVKARKPVPAKRGKAKAA